MKAETRLERTLGRVADFQCRYSVPIIIFSIAVTLIIGLGLPNVRIQSDFSELLPQDLPVVVFDNKIQDSFGASSTVFILARLDESCTSRLCVQDIRDPRVMRMLVDIEDTLTGETSIDAILSAGSVFPDSSSVPDTLEGVKFVLYQVPGYESSFNRDFSATTVVIYANVGTSQEKINQFSGYLSEEIGSLEVPPGVKLTITGEPQLTSEIFALLQEDAVNVTLIAGLIILALMIVVIRNPFRIFQIYTPILFSIIWTFGILGWFNIELSVATAAIGAFIIGLGIEYGIFFVKRFEEATDQGVPVEEAMSVAVIGIGSAITSSATTTIIGFLALTLTILPIIQSLGITLALSIFFSLIAALVVNPAFMIAEEKLRSRRGKHV